MRDMLEGLYTRLGKRLQSLTIFHRIAIGNGFIIVLGAIGGTLITRHLAQEAADLGLILLFAIFGIFISVALNGLIIRRALRPMKNLRYLVDRAQEEGMEIHPSMLHNPDPDINQLASALNRLINELEERNRRLQALSKRVINAQEDERKRIARNLHDETGQSLTMLIVRLENLADKFPSENVEAAERLNIARSLAAQTLKDLRKTITGLRPTILDDLGLIPAMRWYARTNLEAAGITVNLNIPDEALQLHSEQNTALFRIAQEAINNIIRHADAKAADISLTRNQGKICLVVQDDGCGFPLVSKSIANFLPNQLGLIGIRERAELIGGSLEINSAPGQGSKIKVCVPVENPSDG